MKITYVTGNWAKIDSARQILEPLGFEIDNVKLDTVEIQADDVEEVAKYSAKWASEKLKCNVLKTEIISLLNFSFLYFSISLGRNSIRLTIQLENWQKI